MISHWPSIDEQLMTDDAVRQIQIQHLYDLDSRPFDGLMSGPA